MNKTVNINLGGYPLILDEDAYDQLVDYLDTISNHFSKSEGYEEITNDIETRMAEIFQERLGTRKIVNLDDVNEAINTMGTPAEFGVDEEEVYEKTNTSGTKIKTGKRLYRNGEETVIGGVASGLSAYFGIQDPIWIRIAFVVFALSGGLGLPIYIVLWIVLPEAKTSSEKLAMRGEPINVDSISKTIEEEMGNLKKQFDTISEEFKKGAKKKSNSYGDGIEDESNVASDLGYAVKTLVDGVTNILKNIHKPLLIIIGGALMLAFVISWLAIFGGVITTYPYADYFIQPAFFPVVAVSGLFIVSIPLLFSVFWVLKVFLKTKISRPIRFGLVALWILSMVAFSYPIMTAISEFEIQQSNTEMLDIPQINGDNLAIKLVPEEDKGNIIIDQIHLNNGILMNTRVGVEIEKSPNGKLQVIRKVKARGKTETMAMNNAKATIYEPTFDNNTLILDDHYILPKGTQFRDQLVDIIIQVPVGMTISLDNSEVSNTVKHYQNIENGHRKMIFLKNGNWMMEDDGLICLDCDATPQGQSIYEDFDHLELNGNLKVYINQADEFGVLVKDKHDNIDIKVEGNILFISNTISSDEIPIIINMPMISEITASDLDVLKIKGFNQTKLFLDVKNIDDLTIKANIETLTMNLLGDTDAKINGSGKILETIMRDAAQLDAAGYEAKIGKIITYNTSRAELYITDTLYQKANDGSQISLEQGAATVVQRNNE